MMQLEMLQYKFQATQKCKVDRAMNGFEAFDLVNSKFNAEPQQFYDLILLDLHMPISDGYEACKKIYQLFNKESMFSHSESQIIISEVSKLGVNGRKPKDKIIKMNFL